LAVTDRVGFIGLGLMGKPMAKRLLAAGYNLMVHNRSRGCVEKLTQLTRSYFSGAAL
jgi:2-hydroxy-3-oxopropionate reductase